MKLDRFVEEWELTVAGVGLACLFLPMHIHHPDELWAITRMAWWIVFLFYINALYVTYKKANTYRVPTVWHPTAAKWVNRWGVSWKALTVVIPIMLVTFFFVMLVVFA